MMTKVLSFFFFISLFSVCVCGVWLDGRRGKDAIKADKSGVVVAKILVSPVLELIRRSGK